MGVLTNTLLELRAMVLLDIVSRLMLVMADGDVKMKQN